LGGISLREAKDRNAVRTAAMRGRRVMSVRYCILEDCMYECGICEVNECGVDFGKNKGVE
jgi:hypothetical protein